MAHDFADRWRNFGFNPAQNPPTFEDRGEMDLRGLTNEGVLPHGTVGNPAKAITGKVSEIGNLRFVTFVRTEDGARYEGFLVVRQGNRFVISGKLITRTRGLEAQNEEPWVITKP